MTRYEQELQELKSWDEVQFTKTYNGYFKIETAGHGYLVVPTDDKNFKIANKIAGFKGRLAVYLEEDCELYDFMQAIA